MNVLIIPSWYKTETNPIQGSFFFEQAKAIKKLGHNVIIADGTLQGKNDYKSKRCYKLIKTNDEGILTYSYVTPAFGRFRLESAGWKTVYWHLEKIIKQIIRDGLQIDIIHAHSYLPAGMAAVLLGEKHNIPVVFTEHASELLIAPLEKKRQQILTKVVRKSSKIICVSKALQEALLKNIDFDVNKNKMEIIPNLVDGVFSPKKGCLDMKNYTFISVGNLVQSKRFDLTIDAFKRFIESYPKSKLIIIGDGPLRKDLESIVNKLRLQEKIKFLGRVDRRTVAARMRDSSCFILPSDFETFGVVYLEAIASGIPVIATKNGGAEEIINDEVGCLVEKNNVNQLVVAMNYIYNNQVYYSSVRLNKYVKSIYGEDVIGAKLEKVYKSCI